MWVVDLSDYYIEDSFRKPLDIISSWCESSFIGSEQLPLLRRIYRKLPIRIPQYRRLTHKNTNHVHIDINDSFGNVASFLNKPVHLTLHLKRYPFLRI